MSKTDNIWSRGQPETTLLGWSRRRPYWVGAGDELIGLESEMALLDWSLRYLTGLELEMILLDWSRRYLTGLEPEMTLLNWSRRWPYWAGAGDNLLDWSRRWPYWAGAGDDLTGLESEMTYLDWSWRWPYWAGAGDDLIGLEPEMTLLGWRRTWKFILWRAEADILLARAREPQRQRKLLKIEERQRIFVPSQDWDLWPTTRPSYVVPVS